MRRALVVYASRHGATAGIAERIGEVLRSEGVEAVVVPAVHRPDPREFDAAIVGSGIYMGSWIGDGVDYLEEHAEELSERPVWLFSSGPLPRPDDRPAEVDDPYGGALGPADGPGSGGRRRIEAVGQAIRARGHQVFAGAFDPEQAPVTTSERFARMLPPVKRILPAGDFREWDRIEAWARELAHEIGQPVAAG